MRNFIFNLQKDGGFAFFFFLVSRFFALLLSFPTITDTPYYFELFTKGHIFNLSAYKDFFFEYPPLALIPIYFPSIFFEKLTDEIIYINCFFCFMFFVDFCCLKTCQFYARKHLNLDEEAISYMTIIYSLLGLLMFRIIYHRLDIVVAMFFVLSLIFFSAKTKDLKTLFFFNSLAGFFYKIAPAFIMPSAIIFKSFTTEKSLKKIFKKISINSAIFLSVIFAIIFALELRSNHHFIASMLFHQKRGVQLESTYSSFILFFDLIFGWKTNIFHTNSGWDITVNSYFESFYKIFGNLVLLLFWLSLFLVFLHKKRSGKTIKISEENFLETTIVTVLLTLSFQRVLSLQFFIWLIPLVAIWLAKNRSNFLLIIFSSMFFLTFFIFSLFAKDPILERAGGFFLLTYGDSMMVIALFLRNLLLLLATFLLTKNLFKNLLK